MRVLIYKNNERGSDTIGAEFEYAVVRESDPEYWEDVFLLREQALKYIQESKLVHVIKIEE
jgi:hypothetical protein